MAKALAIQDQVAIIGLGRTPYGDQGLRRTVQSLALEAARNAIQDAGIAKDDVDGICGVNAIEAEDLQVGLGIPKLTYLQNVADLYQVPHQLLYCCAAVHSGLCDTALAAWAVRPRQGKLAAKDPFRVSASRHHQTVPGIETESLWVHNIPAYGAIAHRYMVEHDVPRELFGMMAINNRSNACNNPHAVMDTPLTMEDYLSAPMIREPWSRFDYDLMTQTANAFVVTTVDRARELGLDRRMVLVHGATTGDVGHGGNRHYEQMAGYEHLATWVAARNLWRRTDLRPKDMDLFYPYDGTSFIATFWCEAAGFCGPGEAYDLFRESWDAQERRMMFDGRIPVNLHGGNMSEGRTHGGGAIYDAVMQLRGEAGRRQVSDATHALVTHGSIFHNSAAFILRRA